MSAYFSVAGPDGYFVSDDPSLIDGALVHRWISGDSYWAAGRPAAVMTRAIEHSLCIGLYTAAGYQAGFARLVTDQATFAWLCDVYVDPAHRGRGLGAFLVEHATGHPAVAGVRQVLMAEPGRTLYRRLGYGDLAKTERWLERPGPDGRT